MWNYWGVSQEKNLKSRRLEQKSTFFPHLIILLFRRNKWSHLWFVFPLGLLLFIANNMHSLVVCLKLKELWVFVQCTENTANMELTVQPSMGSFICLNLHAHTNTNLEVSCFSHRSKCFLSPLKWSHLEQDGEYGADKCLNETVLWRTWWKLENKACGSASLHLLPQR